ncbi:MAG: hypothetical protein EP338_03765 [Bacteroidetes bacterium]|nr:MAG: hypothetical protein EP338_03765 [Bacteroidota bacterium]
MLEFSKKVLKQVSFDQVLFKKELRKAISRLHSAEDLLLLRDWCMEQFGPRYGQTVQLVFANY